LGEVGRMPSEDVATRRVMGGRGPQDTSYRVSDDEVDCGRDEAAAGLLPGWRGAPQKALLPRALPAVVRPSTFNNKKYSRNS